MSDPGFAIDLARRFLSELRAFGYQPQKAYLFGSFAKNKQNEYSDIDLAVWDPIFRAALQSITKVLKLCSSGSLALNCTLSILLTGMIRLFQ